VRQGRTDAWIAHQLEVSVGDIRSFKREHELVPDDAPGATEDGPAAPVEELDLRAEDDALVAAALEAEQEASDEEDEEPEEDAADDVEGDDDVDAESDSDDKPKRRRRGKRGGRGRRRGGKAQGLEGTFDHGEEGYGLWLDPAIQDDPVYAEHWAGHRSVVVSVEAERIVISRAGEAASGDGEEADDSDE
jgi:hypothetical protein